MIKLLKKILSSEDYIMSINLRNVGYVYPNNPRKFFKLANDKILSKSIMEKNNIPVPETYTIINGLWEIEEKWESISNRDKIVIKPANGSGGNGILILFRKDDKTWLTHSGEIYKKDKIIYHLASILYGVFSMGENDTVLIEYCIEPHSFLSNIYNKGIPDFRIILLKNVPLISMLRVPTLSSGGKANLHQGAIGVGIDMDKGSLTEGLYKNKYIRAHPDSGNEFADQPIPHWKKILNIAIETSKLFPLKYLGIDIITDKNIGPMVIEINARPGLQIQAINKTGLNKIIKQKKMECSC